jgi:CubicO group peptidase (beta-lactamase class C family)
MRRTNVVAIICVLLAVRGESRADDPFARVREDIQKSLERNKVPSLVVAVARDGKIIWEEGFGFADQKNQRQATPHTPYSIASISKPITATGLMVLVDKKQVDLDKPANDYLGDAKLTARLGDAREATIRRLANHSSGLPLHYQFFYDDEPRRVPDFDTSVRRYGHLLAPPGEEFQYANFGYGILGEVLHRVSGRSYGDFLRDEVFVPLGMKQTGVGISAAWDPPAVPRYDSTGQPLPFYDFDHPGASAVYSSAHDLALFGMFHLKQRMEDAKAILSDASIDEMQRGTADCGEQRHYGVGWFVDEDEFGYRTVSHTGGMGGVRCRLVLVPTEKIVVVTLCNKSTDLPLRIAREILGEMLPDYRKKKYEESSKQPDSESRPPWGPPELVGYWRGDVETYEGKERIELWAQPDGDVKVRLAGQLMTLLNQSNLRNGLLTGVFAGQLSTDDSRRRHQLQIRLRLRDEVMNGAVTVMTLPGRKYGNAMSHWAELKRIDHDPAVVAMFNGHSLDGWRIIDENDFERHGEVSVEKQEIVLGAGKAATGIAWAGSPPRMNYEFSLQAKRLEGSDFFCGLTFPVGQDYLTLIVGGWGGGVIGLSNLDGMSAVENETTGYRKFEQDRWYDIRLRVTPGRVQAWIDQEQVVDLETKDRKLSIWWEQEPVRPLGVASWYTKAALRNICLKRLPKSDGKPDEG